MSVSPHLTLYDTTLRDGAQGEGVHFSLSDKLRLAERLASYGLHYVEGGWPGSNDKDRDFFAEAGKLRWGSCKLAAFGSTRRPMSKPPLIPKSNSSSKPKPPSSLSSGKVGSFTSKKSFAPPPQKISE